MKPTIKKVYGVYDTDGQGYPNKQALAYYPIAAAAHAHPAGNWYRAVQCCDVISFEDINYIYKEKLNEKDIIGKCVAFKPIICYRDYIYNNGYNNTKYIIGDELLIKYIKYNKNSCNISMFFILKDDENQYFLLSQENPIKIENFVMSREIATAHALSKLTEEEQKLLGLK